MQCEFTKVELTILDLAIIVRTEDARLTLMDYQSGPTVPSTLKLLETNVERLEALHNKLDKLIKELDITEGKNQ